MSRLLLWDQHVIDIIINIRHGSRHVANINVHQFRGNREPKPHAGHYIGLPPPGQDLIPQEVRRNPDLQVRLLYVYDVVRASLSSLPPSAKFLLADRAIGAGMAHDMLVQAAVIQHRPYRRRLLMLLKNSHQREKASWRSMPVSVMIH